MTGDFVAHRRLKELGWPVTADLAAWLEGMLHKEEERRRAMSAQQATNPSAPSSSTAASSEAGSRGSVAVEDAYPAAALQPETEPSPGPASAAPSAAAVAAAAAEAPTAAAAAQVSPEERCAAADGVDMSLTEPSAGLPASVLARLPRVQGRQGLQGPVGLPEVRREQLRSTSLESGTTLSGGFSSFGSDALLDRYSSMSSVDSQSDLPARGSQVPAAILSPALVHCKISSTITCLLIMRPSPKGAVHAITELILHLRNAACVFLFVQKCLCWMQKSQGIPSQCLQARASAGRDCGTCSGRVHQPLLNAVSSKVLALSSGPTMAGPEWTHLFAAKCHQVTCPFGPSLLAAAALDAGQHHHLASSSGYAESQSPGKVFPALKKAPSTEKLQVLTYEECLLASLLECM